MGRTDYREDVATLEMILVAMSVDGAVMVDESADVGGSADIHEHLDIAIIMLLLIAFFVYGIGAIGRYIGNQTNAPGVTAFFGG